jgi:hypothetical protein
MAPTVSATRPTIQNPPKFSTNASSEMDNQAKLFIPLENKATVYIYRNEFIGFAVPIGVSVNSKELGGTKAKSYFYLELTPGTYLIESRSEEVESLSITVAPQENYFIWQEIKQGSWKARGVLSLVDEENGKQGVIESKRLSAKTSGTDILPLELDPNQPEKE